MYRVLSREEVAALLKGLTEGNIDFETEQPAPEEMASPQVGVSGEPLAPVEPRKSASRLPKRLVREPRWRLRT